MLTDLVTAQSADPSLKLNVCFGTRDKGIFAERIECLGITPRILGMKSRYAPLENVKGGMRLRRIVREGDYDIIHLQEAMIPFPFLAAVTASSRAKVVLQNRGEFNYIETRLQRIAQRVKKAAYQVLVPANVDRLICNSRFTVGQTPLDSRHLPNVEVLYNAIDLARIRHIFAGREAFRKTLCHEQGLAEGVCIVTVVARLVEFKRIDRFIRAFSLTAAGNPQLVALVAGDGPLRETLEQEVALSGLGGRIRFLGHRSDAKEITASSDLFVLPSAGEAFGISALEAVALRVPVLLFADAGGPLEFVRDGVTGCIVADEAELARKIGAFCRKEIRLQTSGEDCAVYDISDYARRIRTIYDELLSTPV